MTRKIIIAGIAVIGFVVAIGSNAWAEERRGGRQDRDGGKYHQNSKTPPGHHYGWQTGKGNPHRPVYRPCPTTHHRPAHHYRPHRPVVVRKHVHHHYHSRDRHDDGRYGVAVAFADPAFAFSVIVSDRR